MFKDSTVGERHGVVRLVNDNEEEFFRAELTEPCSSGSAERWDRGYDHLGVSGCSGSRLLNADLQLRVHLQELFTRLKEEFLSMRKHQQPLFHLKEPRKMREHHRFAGSGWQGHNDTTFAVLVGLTNSF